MKHLLTAIACCLAVAGSAQMPYNPDFDRDGFVGTTDLMAFLSFFGQFINVYTDDIGPDAEIQIIDSVNFTQQYSSLGLVLNSDTIVISEDTDLLLLDVLALGLNDLQDSIPYDYCHINVLLPSDSTVTKLLHVGITGPINAFSPSYSYMFHALVFNSIDDPSPLPPIGFTWFNQMRSYLRAQGVWFSDSW